MYRRFGKRLADIIFGIIVLPFAVVIMLIVAPFIYFEDKGPLFYNAPRVGRNGKDFIMYKLRSMKVGAPDLTMPDGSTYNGPDDPRMTRIGAFMRKTSIDELPQFLNVLKGDMSVVGPRPDLRRETELYQGNEREKLLVRPGVTGYAVVYGRNALQWRDRLALDVYYAHHLTFLLDIKVFFKTFTTVLGQEGVFVEDEQPNIRDTDL